MPAWPRAPSKMTAGPSPRPTRLSVDGPPRASTSEKTANPKPERGKETPPGRPARTCVTQSALATVRHSSPASWIAAAATWRPLSRRAQSWPVPATARSAARREAPVSKRGGGTRESIARVGCRERTWKCAWSRRPPWAGPQWPAPPRPVTPRARTGPPPLLEATVGWTPLRARHSPPAAGEPAAAPTAPAAANRRPPCERPTSNRPGAAHRPA